jgi:hypothetical protein
LLARQMENVLDAGAITFGDLEEQENNAADPAPVLMVNGTVYNSGQRFVMTNLSTEYLPTIFPEAGRPITNRSVESGFVRNLLEPVTPEQVGVDVRRMRLSTALAASAAFPVVLAPVRVRVFPESIPSRFLNRGIPELRESRYLHIADGGLHDNFGTDSVLSLIRALPKEQPVMVIVIDATVRSETLKLNRNKIWYPWTSVLRMYDIGSLRGLGLVGALFHEVRPLGNHSALVIKMAASDASSHSILSQIPTSFRITQANRRKLEEAARENVRAVEENLRREYARLRAGRRFSSRTLSEATVLPVEGPVGNQPPMGRR